MGFNIAIDGPAGAGKSTIARKTAKELDFIYVDTGAMYRALAIYFIEHGINPEETERIADACGNAKVEIKYVDEAQQVYLNGNNVTDKLREESAGSMASVSSAVPEVRTQLLELQRGLASREDVVMDGRDIGTNILPHADVKIYLTASVRTRAERRYLELKEKGVSCNLKEIEQEIQTRDERDMNRETAPLRQAEDAVYIDSSEMTIEEVVAAILREYKKKAGLE